MLVVFVTVFAILALRSLPKVKAGNHVCSDATLRGSYALVGPGAVQGPYDTSFSLIATFNGMGQYTGSEFNTTLEGRPGYLEPYTIPSTSYTVNPDCSVNFTIPATTYTHDPFAHTVTLNGTLVDTGGDEVTGSWYDEPDQISGTFDLIRVAQGRWNNFD
jgi:hypothetical protein